VPIADIFLSRKKRQTIRTGPSLPAQKTVNIGAKINVAEPVLEDSKSVVILSGNVSTERKPKVVSVDIDVDDSKQGGVNQATSFSPTSFP